LAEGPVCGFVSASKISVPGAGGDRFDNRVVGPQIRVKSGLPVLNRTRQRRLWRDALSSPSIVELVHRHFKAVRAFTALTDVAGAPRPARSGEKSGRQCRQWTSAIVLGVLQHAEQRQAKGKTMTASPKQKFLVLYLVPSSVVADWSKTDPATRQPAEQKMREEWGKWMGANGKMIISTEAGGKTKRITSNGVSDTKNDIMLCSFVEAETHEAAAKAFENHPHLQIPQSSIEVMSVRPMGAH
jgi:hypothetical protein